MQSRKQMQIEKQWRLIKLLWRKAREDLAEWWFEPAPSPSGWLRKQKRDDSSSLSHTSQSNSTSSTRVLLQSKRAKNRSSRFPIVAALSAGALAWTPRHRLPI